MIWMRHKICRELIRIPNRPCPKIRLDGLPIDPCEILIHYETVKPPNSQIQSGNLSYSLPWFWRDHPHGIIIINPRPFHRKPLGKRKTRGAEKGSKKRHPSKPTHSPSQNSSPLHIMFNKSSSKLFIAIHQRKRAIFRWVIYIIGNY